MYLDNQPNSGLVMLTVRFVGHGPKRSSTTSSRGTEFRNVLTYSVDLQPERFDDRRPESNIGCEGPTESFRV
jgi:hypothetical protein